MRHSQKYIFLIFALSFIIMGLTGCKSGKQKKDAIPERIVNVDIKKDKETFSKESKKLLEEAMTWLGTPYKYGASEKGRGTDCSGMILMTYLNVTGIKLPRNSAKQGEFCKKIKKEKVKAGDLVFFATGKDKSKISHVGMMVDKTKFIHASSSKGVIISEITTPYYERSFIMFGRVPGFND